MGISWAAERPGRHRQAGWLPRWRQRRAERQAVPVLHRGGIVAGSRGDDSIAAWLDTGYVVPRQMVERMRRHADD